MTDIQGNLGYYGPSGNMDDFDKNRKYFLQMSCNSNNNGIKMMLCSPFYGFKNKFQKQTNDKGPATIYKILSVTETETTYRDGTNTHLIVRMADY